MNIVLAGHETTWKIIARDVKILYGLQLIYFLTIVLFDLLTGCAFVECVFCTLDVVAGQLK